MQFRTRIVFFFLVVLGFQAGAQYNLAQPIPLDPSVKMGRLANGLTYYIRKNAIPEHKIELRLAVNAGAVLEDPDQRGLAHFMEHMNFNGSKHFPKNELVDYLQKIGVQFGADLNAYTGFDETVYILPIPSEDPKTVEQGFTVLEDWAFNNLLDPSEIEKERGVVLEESRLSKGANQRMLRQYFPKLFNGSLYAERLPIGKDSILQQFKPATLTRFYRQWYRPNLMAVVVVGDIDPAVAEQKIKEHFGHFTNPATAKARPSIIPIKTRTKPEAMVITDEEATNTILQVFNYIKPAKKVKTWADYRQSVVQELINSLINNRLQELTQKENPPFVYAYTGTDQFIRGYEAFISYAVLGNNTSKEAVDALVAESERARKFGFLSTELDRAKANLMNRAQQAFAERNKSESGSIVWEYVNNFLESSPVPGAENRYKFLQQVVPGITLSEINTAAGKMTPSTNAFALLTAPASQKSKMPTTTALLSELVAATKQTVSPYEEKAVAGQLIEGEIAPGKVTTESRNTALGTVNMTLSNGVTVSIKPTDFKNDEILLDAWRLGGYQKFPVADKNNARYAAPIVSMMGVKDLSPTDLDKFLSGKSVNVSPYMNESEEGIEGQSSVKDFETMLQLINLYFTQPRKDQALFNSFVTRSASTYRDVLANPKAYFSDTLSKILYNNNPWVSGVPRAEDFSSINLDKSLAIYKQVFGNADGMHFTFVGNLDTSAVRPMLEKYLGSLPASPSQHLAADPGVRPVKGVVNANIKRGKEAQSLINVVWTGETTYDRADNLALRALLDVLNIKIVEKLREELGGMYSGGMYGAVQKRPYTHYTISANIPCGPENVDKLSNALFEIIRNAQSGKIEQKDLDKVKETLRQHYRTNLKDNGTWLSNLSQSFIDQEDPEYFLSFEKRLDALTIADLQKAANKFLNMNNYVRAVLYPENANVPGGVQKTF